MTGRDRVAVVLAVVALVPALAIAAETITYRYDSRGRLTSVVRSTSAASNVVTNYTYDRADNRTVKTTSGSPNPGPP